MKQLSPFGKSLKKGHGTTGWEGVSVCLCVPLVPSEPLVPWPFWLFSISQEMIGGQTHTYENSTFPIFRMRAVNMKHTCMEGKG